MTTKLGSIEFTRLTDGDISDQSKAISLKEGDRSSKEGELEPHINLKKVLPDNLIYSLYRDNRRGIERSSQSNDSTIRDLFSRLDANGSAFDELSNMTNLNLDLDSINERSMKDIIKNLDSMISKLDGNGFQDNDKTLPLKLKDKGKVKDFNVNINLNLRVLKDDKISSANVKVNVPQKQIPTHTRNTFEEKRKTSDSIKLIQEIKDKFKKKVQPTQLTSVKKGSIDHEYKMGSEFSKGGLTGRRFGTSSKAIALTSSKTTTALKEGMGQKSSVEVSKESPISIKPSMSNLKIKNFDKVILTYKALKGFRQ
jgi:hypothetical protein